MAAAATTGSRRQWDRVVKEATANGKIADATVRQDLAWAYTKIEIIRYQSERMTALAAKGLEPGPEASIGKMLWSEYTRRFGEIAMNIAGMKSTIRPDGEGYTQNEWMGMFLGSRSGTIWGGTAEIQRNIVGERGARPAQGAVGRGRELPQPLVRAVVLQGKGDVTVEDVPDPVLPGPDGAIVRVERTAICGSDLHLYHGQMGAAGVRLGHEFVGTVDEVGPSVDRVKRGDRVMVSAVIGCGRCDPCRHGDPVVCSGGLPGKVFGTGVDLPGGQAEAVAVPAADAFIRTIPEAISHRASRAAHRHPPDRLPRRRPGRHLPRRHRRGHRPRSGRHHGPAERPAVRPGTHPRRRHHTPSAWPGPRPSAPSPSTPPRAATPQQVLQATGGRGAQAVIEAVGADQTITDAIFSCAAGGTVSVIGVNLNFAFPFPVPLALIRRLTFRVTLASVPLAWPALIPLLEAGKLHPEEVFTHRMALADAPDAYRMFDQREDGCLKVLLTP